MSHQSKSFVVRQMNLSKIRINHHYPFISSLRQGRYNHGAFRYLSSTKKPDDYESSKSTSTSPKIHVHVEKSSSSSTAANDTASAAAPPPNSPFASAPSSTKSGCGGNHNHTNTSSAKVSRRFTIPPQQQQQQHNKKDESPIEHDNLYSISPSDHLNNVTSVQSRDYENSYLPGILFSKASTSPSSPTTKEIDIQKFYFALRAFHIEIASIRNNESNPQQQQSGLSSGSNLALLRMRWWKESLNYLYPSNNIDNEQEEDNETRSKKKKRSNSGNVGNNPTIRSLKYVVETQKLSRHLFETMIDARIDDLEYDGGSSSSSVDNFNSMKDMIDFYSKTSSSLLLLQLESCGVKLFNDDGSDIENDENVERMKEVANCIGVGVGIMNSIRSINAGRNAIPNDLITKYNVNSNDINDPRSILNGTNDKGKMAIQSAVKEMALVAKDFLFHARLHQSNIPRGDAKITLLSVVPAVRYMERLERLEYDIFHETLRDLEHIESLNGRLWRLGSMFHLWRAWLTGVF